MPDEKYRFFTKDDWYLIFNLLRDNAHLCIEVDDDLGCLKCLSLAQYINDAILKCPEWGIVG